MQKLRIAHLVPYGAENAVTREYLRRVAKCGDSTVREMISDDKLVTPIISTCKEQGYYRPRADRPEEVKAAKQCRDELRRKAMKMMSQLKTFDNFINPSGQMDLFVEVG